MKVKFFNLFILNWVYDDISSCVIWILESRLFFWFLDFGNQDWDIGIKFVVSFREAVGFFKELDIGIWVGFLVFEAVGFLEWNFGIKVGCSSSWRIWCFRIWCLEFELGFLFCSIWSFRIGMLVFELGVLFLEAVGILGSEFRNLTLVFCFLLV